MIIWHFTKDKIQALAGLFHDIATPAFKHCVDFLNEDYMNQESTEGLTTSIIENSPDLTKLLARDNINITEIDNYHLYPIADNDTPRLSSDRLEYSLSNALFAYNLLALEEIRGIYNNIEIETNENGEMELGFKTKKTARKFVFVTSKMSVFYRDDCTRFSMQFIADILKKLSNDGKIQKSDLYKMGDQEVISLIEQSKYSAVFKKWRLAKKVKTSDQEPKGVYFVHHGAKVRYIDPLCQGKRMSELCKLAKAAIDKNLSYDMSKYVYLDFSSSATSSGN